MSADTRYTLRMLSFGVLIFCIMLFSLLAYMTGSLPYAALAAFSLLGALRVATAVEVEADLIAARVRVWAQVRNRSK